MVVETAFRSLESLGATSGQTLLVHGAGTMVGFAAVQMALRRGARVVATAGRTFADRLRGFGASVTSYDDGWVERARDLAGGAPDLVLDASPPGGALPALVRIADGDPRRVLTITDFPAAEALGVRSNVGDGAALRYDAIRPFAELAAVGAFMLPIARRLPFEEWRTAMNVSLAGSARGKLVLLIDGADRS